MAAQGWAGPERLWQAPDAEGPGGGKGVADACHSPSPPTPPLTGVEETGNLRGPLGPSNIQRGSGERWGLVRAGGGGERERCGEGRDGGVETSA